MFCSKMKKTKQKNLFLVLNIRTLMPLHSFIGITLPQPFYMYLWNGLNCKVCCEKDGSTNFTLHKRKNSRKVRGELWNKGLIRLLSLSLQLLCVLCCVVCVCVCVCVLHAKWWNRAWTWPLSKTTHPSSAPDSEEHLEPDRTETKH